MKSLFLSSVRSGQLRSFPNNSVLAVGDDVVGGDHGEGRVDGAVLGRGLASLDIIR